MIRSLVAMTRRHRWWAASVVIGAVIAFVLVYFAPQDLLLDSTVHDPLPTALVSDGRPGAGRAPQASRLTVLGRGTFRSGEHHTTGTALLLRLADGRLVVRLERLDTSNGPDVRIWLTAAAADASDDTVAHARHLDLGGLKANHGDQNYAVPEGTDPSDYRTVTVWCRRFDVVFGAAALGKPAPATGHG